MRLLALLPAAFVALAAGCSAHHAPSEPAAQFLKETVAHYGAAQSYSVAVNWKATSGGTAYGEQRTFEFTAPSKYHVVTVHDSTLQETSVSDSSQVSEYSNDPAGLAQIYDPPDTLAAAKTPQMTSVISGADPLYAFLSGDYGHVVDAALGGQPAYGPDKTIDGVDCRTVTYTSPQFGAVSAVVGIQDHLVRQITFDAGPLLAKQNSPSQIAFAKALPSPLPASFPIVETYDKQVFNAAQPDSTFETRIEPLPPMQGPGAGSQTAEAGGTPTDDGSSEDTLPVGSQAPDVTMVDVNTGQSVKLSSLRGHPIMLDFWATWCPPCRMSLPNTQRYSHDFGAQGLRVMAISQEDRGTILHFLHQNHYTFPTFQDASGSAGTAYRVSGIPALYFIDAQGKISYAQVGYGGPEPEDDALKKLGFQGA